MSTQTIIVVVAILAVIAAIAARRGGPRVTQIDRTIRHKEDDE